MGLFDIFHRKQNKEPVTEVKVAPKIEVTISTPTAKEIEDQASANAEEITKIDAACRKSEHGLSVSEILILEYCRKGKYPNPEGGYQRFWWFEYGVKSVGDVLRKLERGGFICFAKPVELLPSLKVDELKKILSDMDLPVSGKKAELVERISENADNDLLRSYIRSEKYTLTPLGEAEVAANEYIPYLHSHKYTEISIWDVNKNVDPSHWRDYIWGQFNKFSMDYAKNGQWGLYRNVRFSMAEFLAEEGKHRDALAMYGEVCFYDVDGMDIFLDYDDPSDLLVEGILVRMKRVADAGAIDDEEQRRILSGRIKECPVIKRRVPKGEVAELIMRKMAEL